ncbi:SUKH-3 domain-containing protein [Streptomyces sp. NPDC051597]|uniref:SUKH-3 domain-containing protein n=1 Tax=Streptomyces sp. NPDC051597 TaxID=3155049 RepID=UPI003425E372
MERELSSAGWFQGRSVDTKSWLEYFESTGLHAHPAARGFLAEFGGIAVDISGPGVSRSREPFEFDPMQCLGEEDRFMDWSEHIGRSIFPIGVHDLGRFFLGIDEDSSIYLVETWLASFGRMPEAMENLVLGVRATVIDDGAA